MVIADDEKEKEMYPECKTYQDVTALYLAIGWGCKCCGRLNTLKWYECSGDTYCRGCARHIAAEVEDVEFTEYPDGELTIKVEPADDNSQGFTVAEFARREHERIYGHLPSYIGE
jgi:hypothetical protein